MKATETEREGGKKTRIEAKMDLDTTLEAGRLFDRWEVAAEAHCTSRPEQEPFSRHKINLKSEIYRASSRAGGAKQRGVKAEQGFAFSPISG